MTAEAFTGYVKLRRASWHTDNNTDTFELLLDLRVALLNNEVVAVSEAQKLYALLYPEFA